MAGNTCSMPARSGDTIRHKHSSRSDKSEERESSGGACDQATIGLALIDQEQIIVPMAHS